MGHPEQSLSIRLAEILRSDSARCRACGASFPRTARVEDLCVSCRLPRHDTASSSRRTTLLTVAAISLTALSAFVRLMARREDRAAVPWLIPSWTTWNRRSLRPRTRRSSP